jgi:DNA-binding SARP family transcriptional activator/pimeloyl-ACP methyl ester carboxylesterase
MLDQLVADSLVLEGEMPRLQVRVLGPVEVVRGGDVLDLGGPRQRALFAALAVRANAVVPADLLLDEIWPDTATDRARHSLQVHIANLRKRIAPDDVIVTRAPGYVLRLERDQLDTALFEDLATEGRAALARGDIEEAAATLRRALESWHGDPLADFAYEDFAASEIRRLAEARASVTEDCLEAELACGRHAEVVGSIEKLVQTSPLRERLWAHYMVALYRSGRQGEALRAYQDLRTTLRDELDVEPSRELSDLEAAVRDHASTLDLKPVRRSAADVPATKYAHNDDVSLAYQTLGHGPVDVLYVPGFVSNVELCWELPALASRLRRLAELGRVTHFDKRGTGCSDRTHGTGSVEDLVDDMRAVSDAAGIDQAVVIGLSEGVEMSLLYAANYPERVRALVLWSGTSRALTAPDYPIGADPVDADNFASQMRELWGTGRALGMLVGEPNAELLALLARYERQTSSPEAAELITRRNTEIDVRYTLSSIRVPTLVVHRTGDPIVRVEQGRYIAEHIAGALMIEFPGDFHLAPTGRDDAPVYEAIAEFVQRSAPRSGPTDRSIVTFLVADVDDATRRALRDYGARVVDRDGDRVVATFRRPGAAIRAAQTLKLTAGLHTGALQTDEHVARAVRARCSPGEVLVTNTVKDLAASAQRTFVERGPYWAVNAS